jgi:hypothetical protein
MFYEPVNLHVNAKRWRTNDPRRSVCISTSMSFIRKWWHCAAGRTMAKIPGLATKPLNDFRELLNAVAKP